MRQERCLALGMGAIGRAVSGYAMTQAGVHVTFADIVQPQIDAVNAAGGYWLETADIYTKQQSRSFISGVRAVHVGSAEAEQEALQADYLISAVGPRGFRALLEQICSWLALRDAPDARPLYCMIFENDGAAVPLLQEAVAQKLGACPAWLHIAKCSIERMSKLTSDPEHGMLAIGETFFPIISSAAAMRGCGIEARSDVLELVDDVGKYYARKLYTNNLGHAVLSYAGTPKGYRNTVEAMADPEIRAWVEGALHESGRALIHRYGFSETQMQKHLETLLLRYENPGLIDDLQRLGRDPLRKISPQERIMQPLDWCGEYGLPRTDLVRTLHAAIHYADRQAENTEPLIRLLAESGEEEILKTVCHADHTLTQEVMKLTKQ